MNIQYNLIDGGEYTLDSLIKMANEEHTLSRDNNTFIFKDRNRTIIIVSEEYGSNIKMYDINTSYIEIIWDGQTQRLLTYFYKEDNVVITHYYIDKKNGYTYHLSSLNNNKSYNSHVFILMGLNFQIYNSTDQTKEKLSLLLVRNTDELYLAYNNETGHISGLVSIDIHNNISFENINNIFQQNIYPIHGIQQYNNNLYIFDSRVYTNYGKDEYVTGTPLHKIIWYGKDAVIERI